MKKRFKGASNRNIKRRKEKKYKEYMGNNSNLSSIRNRNEKIVTSDGQCTLRTMMIVTLMVHLLLVFLVNNSVPY